MVSMTYKIMNNEGLHARPATDFCTEATKFKSEISVIKDGDAYEAKSILMVLCIGAVKGDEIEIRAEGEDENEAVEALIRVLDESAEEGSEDP